MLNVAELIDRLDKVKPVTTKKFNLPYEDWVFFDTEYMFAMNGQFFIRLPYPTEKMFALPSKQTRVFLANAGETVNILYGNDSVSLDYQVGKKSAQADFSYPFSSIEKYMRSFYIAPDDSERVEVDGRFMDALAFAELYVYKDNIEYSNVYSFDSILFSTNGSIIAEADTCAIPDTSFSFGTGDVLRSLADDVESIQNDETTVTYRMAGGAIVSALKNIGKATAITKYIPDISVLENIIDIRDPPEWGRAIKAAMNFDDEFKRRDKLVHVALSPDGAVISFQGVRTKYIQEIAEVSSDVPVAFRAHPTVLLQITEGSDVRFNPTKPYLYVSGDYTGLHLWVEIDEET